eukprot:5429964-Pleurochrysis_carterae.AAC.1
MHWRRTRTGCGAVRARGVALAHAFARPVRCARADACVRHMSSLAHTRADSQLYTHTQTHAGAYAETCAALAVYSNWVCTCQSRSLAIINGGSELVVFQRDSTSGALEQILKSQLPESRCIVCIVCWTPFDRTCAMPVSGSY